MIGLVAPGVARVSLADVDTPCKQTRLRGDMRRVFSQQGEPARFDLSGDDMPLHGRSI